MNQHDIQQEKRIAFKVEQNISDYPPRTLINEILHTKLNKQIQSALDRRIGAISKYTIDYGVMRLVETTLGFRARSKYELRADLVFMG